MLIMLKAKMLKAKMLKARFKMSAGFMLNVGEIRLTAELGGTCCSLPHSVTSPLLEAPL